MFVWACFGVACIIVDFSRVNQIDRVDNCPNGNDAIRIPYQLQPGVNDPEGIFALYEERVKTRIDRMDQLLAIDPDSLHKLGVPMDVLVATKKALMDVWKGLQQMKTSSDMYEITHSILADSGKGYTEVDPANGCIEIRIGKGDTAQEVIGHEIRHGVQYERGEISLIAGYKNGGTLYDIHDEIDAYESARLTVDNKNPNIPLTRQDVIKLNDDYRKLPRRNLRLDSRKGKRLKERTANAANAGLQNHEYYKGWQLDYQK
jgi:hypothetical protein